MAQEKCKCLMACTLSLFFFFFTFIYSWKALMCLALVPDKPKGESRLQPFFPHSKHYHFLETFGWGK